MREKEGLIDRDRQRERERNNLGEMKGGWHEILKMRRHNLINVIIKMYACRDI